MAKPYQNLIDIAVTLHGITEKSATYIIAEIGTGTTAFKSDKHLCSLAGLTPKNNGSAGVYLKLLLIQCANAAIRDKKNPYFKFKYDRIKKRRGHKRVIVAIARMMLTFIYHMFLKKELFNPSDTDYTNIPERLYQRHRQ
ncbi:transposase [Thermoanaerobacterium sp. RBIITD]|uniref:transposase n=1 Tax=Thermoanaerobacterium sp. RBIITD TaxID=1550240 RepID=UPI000BB96DE2|nr:transposase [Thermoanaerobacterium sp. RBIITD]